MHVPPRIDTPFLAAPLTTSKPCLFVVDDEEVMRVLLVEILAGAGYDHVMTASSASEARGLLAGGAVDVVLTDMQMPGESGLELLKHIHDDRPGVAVLMVTGTDDRNLADQALTWGAYGYIIKPFRCSEIVIGVTNALRRQELERDNHAHRNHLEETVRSRTEDLWSAIVRLEAAERTVRASRTETIERLAVAGEFRDEDTGFHVARMSWYCKVLARESGDDGLRDHIREASSLHDVGKIGIPDRVLLKPGALSPSERSIMEEHAAIGHRILEGSESPLLRLAAEIALTHHEKIDGTGYPRGLAGDEIPLAGRIAGIADVFDALTSKRVYRAAFPVMQAVEMMREGEGSHFDPDLLAVFLDHLPEVLDIRERHGPGARSLHGQAG